MVFRLDEILTANQNPLNLFNLKQVKSSFTNYQPRGLAHAFRPYRTSFNLANRLKGNLPQNVSIWPLTGSLFVPSCYAGVGIAPSLIVAIHALHYHQTNIRRKTLNSTLIISHSIHPEGDEDERGILNLKILTRFWTGKPLVENLRIRRKGLTNDNVEYCSYFLRESSPRISWWCDGPDEKRLDLELFEELVIQFMLDWLA